VVLRVARSPTPHYLQLTQDQAHSRLTSAITAAQTPRGRPPAARVVVVLFSSCSSSRGLVSARGKSTPRLLDGLRFRFFFIHKKKRRLHATPPCSRGEVVCRGETGEPGRHCPSVHAGAGSRAFHLEGTNGQWDAHKQPPASCEKPASGPTQIQDGLAPVACKNPAGRCLKQKTMSVRGMPSSRLRMYTSPRAAHGRESCAKAWPHPLPTHDRACAVTKEGCDGIGTSPGCRAAEFHPKRVRKRLALFRQKVWMAHKRLLQRRAQARLQIVYYLA
jgi:hypothetical protein